MLYLRYLLYYFISINANRVLGVDTIYNADTKGKKIETKGIHYI